MLIQMQMRRGTTTEWSTANPVLAAGELGLDTTLNKFKVGDGTTAWNSLLYASERASLIAYSAADLTLTNGTGAQSLFQAANDTLTVAASTSYLIDSVFHVYTTGTTSHTLSFGLGGTATVTSMAYRANVSQNATGSTTPTPTANYTSFISVKASTAITAATATAIYRTVHINGVIRINAAGTLIPQVAFSAAPGVAPVVAANSYFRLTPIGTNTDTFVGPWA